MENINVNGDSIGPIISKIRLRQGVQYHPIFLLCAIRHCIFYVKELTQYIW